MSDQMPPRWAVPTPPPHASRALRAQHAGMATRARHDMRWIWNEFCSGFDLTRRVVPTGTVTREPPRIGRITLGPPTRFTVELRPGQVREDISQWDRRLAAAFGVPEVRVDDLVPGWVVVELVERLAVGGDDTRRTRPPAGPPVTGGDTPRHGLPGPRRPHGQPRSWHIWRSRRHDV